LPFFFFIFDIYELMITSMFIVGASDDNRIKLPNVHVGLHFAEFAAEYGPLMNCNVLAGEKRHKLV
jgi:hypothetical protein